MSLQASFSWPSISSGFLHLCVRGWRLNTSRILNSWPSTRTPCGRPSRGFLSLLLFFRGPRRIRRSLPATAALGPAPHPSPALTAYCLAPTAYRPAAVSPPAFSRRLRWPVLLPLTSATTMSGLRQRPATTGHPAPGWKTPGPVAAINHSAHWRPALSFVGHHLCCGLPGGFWIQFQPAASSFTRSPFWSSTPHCRWYASPHLGSLHNNCLFWFPNLFL